MTSTRSLWPLGITLSLVLFAIGAGTLVVLACRQKTELVAHDYYEQEIRYQGQIDRLERTRALGAAAKVVFEPGSRQLIVSLPAAQAAKFPEGRIELYRPSAAVLDRRLELAVDAQGRQVIDAKSLQPGPWKVRVVWRVEGADYLLEEKLVVHPTASAQ